MMTVYAAEGFIYQRLLAHFHSIDAMTILDTAFMSAALLAPLPVSSFRFSSNSRTTWWPTYPCYLSPIFTPFLAIDVSLKLSVRP